MKDLVFVLLLVVAVCLGCGGTGGSTAKEQWTASKKLAGKEQGLSHVGSIAADETAVYAVIGGTVADQNEGHSGLRRVDIATGEVTTLENGKEFPQTEQGGIAIDDKYVYWNAGGKIMRVAKTGGSPSPIVTDNVGIGIDMVVDGTHVYWADHGYYSPGQPTKPKAIYAAPIGGGATEAIVADQLVPGNLRVDDTYLYWTTSSGISRRAKAGGAIEAVLAISDKEGVDELAIDGDSLYFGFRGAGESRWQLKRIAKTGGEPSLIAKTFSTKEIQAANGSVYFFDEDGSTSDALYRVPKTGGEPTKLDSGYAGGPMFVNKTNIFFSSLDDVLSIPLK